MVEDSDDLPPTTTRRESVQIELEFWDGPNGSIPYVDFVDDGARLGVSIRDQPEWSPDEDADPENPSGLQVHVGGTAEALELLGRRILALARSTAPPNESMLLVVRNHFGGTIDLKLWRTADDPSIDLRDDEYDRGFRHSGPRDT